MAEFLSSLSWHNILIPVIGFVVDLIVYAPFVAMYDKQCLAEEAAAEAEELAA
jgi:PTS system cellobiose-specific IIC component